MKLLTLILLTTSLYATLARADSKTSGLPNCVVCHGSNLQGNIVVQAPNLSILPDWYIQAQLDAYEHHWRDGDISQVNAKDMTAVALALDDKERAKALKFISAKTPQAALPTVSGDIKHGKQLFMACITCHGDNAQGNQALQAPPLAGQNDWYIVSQLQAYKTDIRGTMADDNNGNMMRNSAKLLSTEQDMLDVASYLISIKISKE
jgi:cytochrome c553